MACTSGAILLIILILGQVPVGAILLILIILIILIILLIRGQVLVGREHTHAGVGCGAVGRGTPPPTCRPPRPRPPPHLQARPAKSAGDPPGAVGVAAWTGGRRGPRVRLAGGAGLNVSSREPVLMGSSHLHDPFDFLVKVRGAVRALGGGVRWRGA